MRSKRGIYTSKSCGPPASAETANLRALSNRGEPISANEMGRIMTEIAHSRKVWGTQLLGEIFRRDISISSSRGVMRLTINKSLSPQVPALGEEVQRIIHSRAVIFHHTSTATESFVLRFGSVNEANKRVQFVLTL